MNCETCNKTFETCDCPVCPTCGLKGIYKCYDPELVHGLHLTHEQMRGRAEWLMETTMNMEVPF